MFERDLVLGPDLTRRWRSDNDDEVGVELLREPVDIPAMHPPIFFSVPRTLRGAA